MIALYKRNAQGKPIFWTISPSPDEFSTRIDIHHGLVGNNGHKDHIFATRDRDKEIKSLIASKRKEGYKELKDLYDNAPVELTGKELQVYLDCYLPKFNTHEDGKFIPMLCKTLQDNRPFERGSYIGDWKINGERCIITAEKSDDLFKTIKLHYRSREGVDWTDKLSYMDEYLLPILQETRSTEILDMMIEEGVGLDGEMYIPGYTINDINSFIKNVDLPQHYDLQFWCYDIAIENMPTQHRKELLSRSFSKYIPLILTKEGHLNTKHRFIILPYRHINNITEATETRDYFISLGFEGLVIREENMDYQFGGRRNNAMLKYKKKEDGLFDVVAVKEDKRGLPIFTLKNDLNDELFDATINVPQDEQRRLLIVKDSIIAHGKALVEYRERSGVKQVPFHAKIIKINI